MERQRSRKRREKMSVKPQYETYRYVGEICRLKSQSIVECRLPGSEISAVLAVHAKLVPDTCACADGEVTYNGKLLLIIVYEDGERKICRAERGAEFFHKAEGTAVTPACFAKSRLTAENVTCRREGSGLYVSVVVDAALTVYGSKQIEYLSGGDGIVAKKDSITVCAPSACRAKRKQRTNSKPITLEISCCTAKTQSSTMSVQTQVRSRWKGSSISIFAF